MWIREQPRSQEIILLKHYENLICYNLVTGVDLFIETNYEIKNANIKLNQIQYFTLIFILG